MKLLSGDKKNEHILEFDDQQEFESFFARVDREGSFVLRTAGLDPGATFRATVIGSTRSRRLRPIKTFFDRDQFRIVLSESASAKPVFESSQQQTVVLQTPETVPEPKQHAPESVPEQSEQEPEEKREAVKSVSERIRALSVTEKAMLAMKCDLAERRVLMQDNNPKIQEFLLRNPKLTDPEIAWMAKNPMSAIPTLMTIVQHKEWMSGDSIRQGILTNPKTPSHIVLDKINTLSGPDLIKMYQARNLRDDVRTAVERQIKRRGIRIPKPD